MSKQADEADQNTSCNKWSGTGKLLKLQLSYLSQQLRGKQARQYSSKEQRRDDIEEITLSLQQTDGFAWTEFGSDGWRPS